MLNAIGLQNVGVDVFLDEKMPELRKKKVPVIVNFFGNTEEEYVALAARLDGAEGIAALEANISCPNVKAGGIAFGTDASVASKLIGRVRKSTSLPLIAKLSPNVTDIKVMARAVEEAGADILSMINTLTGMSIDVRTRRSRLANMTGGLSGPAIRPVAVRMVWEAAKSVNIPIIGIGGIVSAEDALEFILAGASAVQIGTASFISPTAAIDIVKGLEDFLIAEGISKISDMIGALEG